MYSRGLVDLRDPSTGEWRTLTGHLQLYTPDAPADSLVINYRLGTDLDGIWEVVASDGTLDLLDYSDVRDDHSIALSPDGQTVAFGTYQVHVWREGESTTVRIPNPDEIIPQISLVWSPPAWRVVED